MQNFVVSYDILVMKFKEKGSMWFGNDKIHYRPCVYASVKQLCRKRNNVVGFFHSLRAGGINRLMKL